MKLLVVNGRPTLPLFIAFSFSTCPLFWPISRISSFPSNQLIISHARHHEAFRVGKCYRIGRKIGLRLPWREQIGENVINYTTRQLKRK
ncbi:MAG: hypothetical protein QXF77_07210, partial [Candidatus Jordarchaeales archaeon]